MSSKVQLIADTMKHLMRKGHSFRIKPDGMTAIEGTDIGMAYHTELVSTLDNNGLLMSGTTGINNDKQWMFVCKGIWSLKVARKNVTLRCKTCTGYVHGSVLQASKADNMLDDMEHLAEKFGDVFNQTEAKFERMAEEQAIREQLKVSGLVIGLPEQPKHDDHSMDAILRKVNQHSLDTVTAWDNMINDIMRTLNEYGLVINRRMNKQWLVKVDEYSGLRYICYVNMQGEEHDHMQRLELHPKSDNSMSIPLELFQWCMEFRGNRMAQFPRDVEKVKTSFAEWILDCQKRSKK